MGRKKFKKVLQVCIILWNGAIIGVYTKEKIINTYPPLFKSAPAQWCAGADFLRGECYAGFCLKGVCTHNLPTIDFTE